jgi:hypothetical protein
VVIPLPKPLPNLLNLFESRASLGSANDFKHMLIDTAIILVNFSNFSPTPGINANCQYSAGRRRTRAPDARAEIRSYPPLHRTQSHLFHDLINFGVVDAEELAHFLHRIGKLIECWSWWRPRLSSTALMAVARARYIRKKPAILGDFVFVA